MGITDLRQFEKERGVYVAAELNVVGAGGVRYHKFNRIMSIKVGCSESSPPTCNEYTFGGPSFPSAYVRVKDPD